MAKLGLSFTLCGDGRSSTGDDIASGILVLANSTLELQGFSQKCNKLEDWSLPGTYADESGESDGLQ